MIGALPKSLSVNGKEYAINSDFRVALLIFEAYNDADLNDYEKASVCLECIYKEIPDDTSAALKAAVWYLDGGDMPKAEPQKHKLLDWTQDEGIIFPAVNKVAGCETRAVEYMHWWSFLGLFNEIGEGLFSTIMSVRHKKAKGKKLEKYEQEFYRSHKAIIDIKQRYSAEEQAEIDRFNKLLD